MRRKPHFVLLGVPVRLRRNAVLPGVVVGLLIYALARAFSNDRRTSLALGLASALTWYEADLLHVGGHILSSRMAGAPMDYVRWGIFAINGYANHDVSPRQHIGRSIGGPIASGLAALGYWLAWRALGNTLAGKLALVAFLQNGLTALGSLFPLPVIDGGVILANLRKL